MTTPPSPALLAAASGGEPLSGGALAAVVVVIAALVVLAGFFAMSETALTRITRVKATTFEEEGKKGAKALVRVAGAPERFINPILLLVLICHTLMASLIGAVVGPYGSAAFAAAYVGELVLIFVICESGPKTFAVQRPERAALFAAPIITAIAGFPPIRLLTRGLIGLSNVLFPGSGNPVGPSTSEEEILALTQVAEDEQVIEMEERELIHSIIEFGDTITREVMVARPDVVAVDAHAAVDDALEVALLAGKSRIPVQNRSIDDIVGIVFLKDLVRAARDGHGDRPVQALARQATVIPETKRVAELMREMQKDKFHMAVVVDEYGGVAGIVTLEDLIEELVGEIVDEYDEEEPLITGAGDGTWLVQGQTPVDLLNEELDLAVPEDDDWDTVGGYLFHRLGQIPKGGEEVVSDGHRFTIVAMGGNRIERVRVERVADDERAGADA